MTILNSYVTNYQRVRSWNYEEDLTNIWLCKPPSSKPDKKPGKLRLRVCIVYLIIVIDLMEQLLTGAHHLMTFRNTSPDVLEGAGSELYLSVRPVEPRSGGPAFHGIWLNSSRKNDPQKTLRIGENMGMDQYLLIPFLGG